MSGYKPVFIIREDITVDEAITTISHLSRQTTIIQAEMTAKTSAKNSIKDHFEEVNELAAQVHSNLMQIAELAEWLDSRNIQEVRS